MTQPGWPPGLGRRSIGSIPIEALRAVRRSKIAIGTSSGPEWLNELKVRITREGSTKMTKRTTICAGIDTGKRKLDVAIEGNREQLQVENTSEGHAVLLAWLRRHRVKRVGIEASGGYEQPVVAELRRKRLVVVVFQPAQVRGYAKFHSQRAKNDRIELKALIASIRKHPDLARRLDLINSIDGIGLPTAVAILVRMPEIGQITREQAVALAGLAPYDDDSGEQVGVRHIEGGRKRLRRALYTASLAASFRWNRQLIQLYQRLTAAGKEHKRALVACARKMLIFANTVVARGTPWCDEPPVGSLPVS